MKTENKKVSLKVIRLSVQIMFFILLPALFVQTLNGVKQIYLALMNQNFSLELLPQIIEIVAFIPLTILLGRFFCGWMCGFGSFTDFIYLLSGKFFKRKFKINKKIDTVLKYAKYLLLMILAVFAWSLNLSIFNKLSPWDVFGMTAVIGNAPDFEYVISNLFIALIFFLLIIIASIFVERFFCRYLCPMGAVFAICSKLRIGKIKKPREKCGKCMICTNNCAMGIPLYETDVVTSAECINCMKCISACPRHNTSYTIAKKDVQPLLVSAVSTAFMLGSYYAVDSAINLFGSSIGIVSESQTSFANKIYADGTYEGTGIGYRGRKTIVSVTIKDDKITDISTVSYGDDKQYYNRAFTTISKNIVSSQSADVDAVSGATFSSDGIMEAVENALSLAKKAQTSSTETTSSTLITQDSSTQTGTTGEATNDTTTASAGTASAGTASAGTASAGTSSAATASAATANAGTASQSTTVSEAATTVVTGIYKDGTYQGSGTGFKGTTKVSVVVSGGKITTITTVSYNDDRQYYSRAFTTISKNIVSSQSTDVDTVSGATFSSNGIIKAVENALSSANS